jgi:hypothetical protein
VFDVCQAIATVIGQKSVKVLSVEADWLDIVKGFDEKWNFPNCIGAVDGKHIVLHQPANSGTVEIACSGSYIYCYNILYYFS